jgi:Glycosyltransferase GT-D fold
MAYPKVLSEDETLDLALEGWSLARYGDGEMSIMTGGNCVSQAYDKGLAHELRQVARFDWAGGPRLLPCIPNAFASPRLAWRQKWADGKFAALYDPAKTYGSAFITRPDSAPQIDTPAYWAKVRQLWEGKDVVLVKGTERSLRSSLMSEARSIREVDGRNVTKEHERGHRDAFKVIDRIEAEIGKPDGPVILCLGPTATVLAARLAWKGVHALDLGHLGMFMRHAGLYAFDLGALISKGYRNDLIELRKRQRFGADGHKHADAVRAYAAKVGADTTLDYGCGEQTLAVALKPFMRVLGYDPAIDGRDAAPKPCDLVVALDVLEHVEPERLDAVLDHIWKCAAKAAFLVISTRPANTILPSGRNAHLIVEDGDWWNGRVLQSGWTLDKREDRPHEVRLWLRK